MFLLGYCFDCIGPKVRQLRVVGMVVCDFVSRTVRGTCESSRVAQEPFGVWQGRVFGELFPFLRDW